MVGKFLQAFLVIGALAACVRCEINIRTFTQPLDHFDESGTKTWDNTYYIDESFYKPGGPIFVYVGDMQFFSTYARLSSSHFTDIAREVGALLVGTEHRYFGNSHPVPDLSVNNLAYMTTSQALEDIAALIRYIRSSSPYLEKAKVIAAGMGQGGALATWLRQGYPDLIHAAWASSAKLNAVLNNEKFLTTTAESVKIYGGLLCYDRMAKAFSMLEDKFQGRDFTQLMEIFKMCPNNDDFDDEVAGALFFGTLATTIGVYIGQLHAPGITSFCGFLEKGEDPMKGLSDWYYNVIHRAQGCVPGSIDDRIGIYMDSHWSSAGAQSGGRQQLWQICNEFGWFRSSDAPDHPFGNRFPYRVMFEQCGFLLNWTMTIDDAQKKIDNTNALFGGLSPKVTRVYFTNGELHSDKSLSVLQDLNDEAPADVIPYFGYGADFMSMDTTTNAGLRRIQERVRSLILQWLATDN
ncbi:putative serine protease K12H4.7 [Lutzomyia longipalpis]|uniref:putative serine protease K12H4.7 n=1 Tax=Lutzomyia longipalpis TaxID=7200 RepID=UPI00248417BD|nr:putative serine protease K12H4.7 [Lutzomyia longipalpis]